MDLKGLISIFFLYLCIGNLFAQQNAALSVGTKTADSVAVATTSGKVVKKESATGKKEKYFVPVPSRAVWMSAIFPGLGQIYNRKYWKLPLIYGGYAGLTYGLAWNNQYLKDYTSAYNDLADSDPSTNHFMDILPQSMKDAYNSGTLTKDQLTTILKNQKDFFRRNRDLTIISMVGLYFVTMVDAYVDAQLFEFDISPDLSMKLEPTMIRTNQFDNRTQAVGLQCSIKF